MAPNSTATTTTPISIRRPHRASPTLTGVPRIFSALPGVRDARCAASQGPGAGSGLPSEGTGRRQGGWGESPSPTREDAALDPARDPHGEPAGHARHALERSGVAGPVLEHEPAVDIVEQPVHD